MKKEEKSIRYKGILALLLIILIFIAVRFALLYIGARIGETRENELIQLKMSALTDIVSDANARRAAAAEHVSEHVTADTQLMTDMLKEFCTDDIYDGPRVFSGGFVAELCQDRVLLPPETEVYAEFLTPSMIEHGLLTGEIETGTPAENSDATGMCFFSFGEIAKNLVYVNVLSEDEYASYLDRYSGHIYDRLETADESFGGMTLVVREEEGSLTVLRRFGSVDGTDPLQDSDLIEQTIRTRPTVLTLNERGYQCSVTQLDDGAGEETLFVLQIIPQVSVREQNTSRTLVAVLLMVIIFIAVSVYVISVQHFTAKHSMSEEQARHYTAEAMRRRMLTLGILSAVIVFASAVLVESVGQLYMELRYGRDTLRLFSGQVERETQDQLRSIAREEETWYVTYGEKIAALLAEHPELAVPEKLREYCDTLEIDYLMLFDSKGNETACNRDYVGFNLGSSPEDERWEFRQLLHGVPSIIHEASFDPQTRLERQLIGVKIPASEPGHMHGAMIMALLPGQTDGGVLALKEDRVLSLETARGTSCFAADAAAGTILYASNPAMLGKTVSEYGLPENSLQDGYMDFTSIGGTTHLVVTVREGEHVYYYAVESGTMFGQVILYGVLAALLFAVVFALIVVFLLRGYSEKAIEEWSELRTRDRAQTARRHTDDMDAVSVVRESEAEEEAEPKPDLLHRITAMLRWDRKSPRERAAVVIRIGLIVLILCCLDVLQGKELSNENYDTMLGFLLHGDWMRGLNLFSLCSSLMILSIAYLVNILSSLILKLTGLLFTGHGETICRLIYSCIKYITVLGVIYFCLEYFGFPTSTILAALGAASLSISLGAQDLIADILAGLAIVFDGSFRVGDVVEINGRQGVVLELGVRATRMRIPVNNILTINNHEIKDVLNLSKECSECVVDFRVSMDMPLSDLERIMEHELPLIGEKESRILFGPYLVGVTALPDAKSFGAIMTLSVGAMCDQKDEDEVRVCLNRELKLLTEREGIKMI